MLIDLFFSDGLVGLFNLFLGLCVVVWLGSYAYVWTKAKLSGRDFYELLREYDLPVNPLEWWTVEVTEDEQLEWEETDERIRNNNRKWWIVIKLYGLFLAGAVILILLGLVLDEVGVL